ncbi:unnamed protein product [Calypogeia fissa]
MEHFNGERELDRVCSVFCYRGTRSGSATGISLCLCLCFACFGKLLGLLCGGTVAEHFRQICARPMIKQHSKRTPSFGTE